MIKQIPSPISKGIESKNPDRALAPSQVSVFGMQQANPITQGQFLTPEKNGPVKKTMARDSIDRAKGEICPGGEPQPRPPSQQQNGDGTFYINNITNNIILDKGAKQEDGVDKAAGDAGVEETAPVLDTKTRVLPPSGTPSTPSLPTDSKCHCALKYSAHHTMTPGSSFSAAGNAFFPGNFGFQQNPHQFYPYPFSMMPSLGMFGPGFGQFGHGPYQPTHFAGSPQPTPYGMQPQLMGHPAPSEGKECRS